MPQENYLERPLPSSEDSERIILGSILLDDGNIAQCVEQLVPEDFYSVMNRRMFTAMVNLFNSSSNIDPVLVLEELKKDAAPPPAISTITNLTYGLPHISDLQDYITVIKNKSLARRIIRISNNLVTTSLSEEYQGDELLEYCESQLYAAGNSQITSFATIRDLSTRSVERAELSAQTGNRVTGLPTHFTDLDMMTLGLQRGEVTILASRPSMGKTALSLMIAQNVAFRGNGVVAFFSLEMGDLSLTDRIICSEANVNSHSYRTGRLDESEWERVRQVRDSISESRLFIDETPAIGITAMRAKLRRLEHSERQLDLVEIDYLQLMSATAQSREQEVSAVSRNLKVLAKEFDVPIIANCQFNRSPETRASHLPTLSDLRESGAIEQDADNVLGLYRADYYEQDPQNYTNIAQLLILKQRNGPTGTISLQYSPQNSTFRNLSHVEDF